MTCSSDVADYQWLTGDEAGALLSELSANPLALHTAAERLRKNLSPDRTHLLLEQVVLRRHAAEKFQHADRMFFARTALEQATDQWVAAYKATRFAGRVSVADLCCGIGGDLLALAGITTTVGVDQSSIAAHLASANVRAALDPATQARTSIQTCDVERFDVTQVAAWHLDPDRRPLGSRTTLLAWSSPAQSVIDQLLSTAPHAAIKLAPAAEVPDEWHYRCELEWIGRDRQCRQLVAWHGDLAQVPGLRRATVLPTERAMESEVRSVIGKPDLFVPIADRLERFVMEPDPAVLAARLTGALAAEHGLAAVCPGPAYLTGVAPNADAALACFEVEDILPAKLRTLSQALRKRGIGNLEIKKRGVDLDPERIRRELKLQGDGAATLLFTPLAGRQVAILARRIVNCEQVSEFCPLTTDY